MSVLKRKLSLIVIRKAVAGIPAHMKECILKAGRITAGEELFGIGRITPSAKGPGQCELEGQADRLRCGSNRDGLRSR